MENSKLTKEDAGRMLRRGELDINEITKETVHLVATHTFYGFGLSEPNWIIGNQILSNLNIIN